MSLVCIALLNISCKNQNKEEVAIVTEPKEEVSFEHIDCGSGACPIDFK